MATSSSLVPASSLAASEPWATARRERASEKRVWASAVEARGWSGAAPLGLFRRFRALLGTASSLGSKPAGSPSDMYK